MTPREAAGRGRQAAGRVEAGARAAEQAHLEALELAQQAMRMKHACKADTSSATNWHKKQQKQQAGARGKAAG